MNSARPVIETEDLTIRFGGNVAVNNVSCKFHAGTLTAIVGPNGAGKTTYFNLISGQLKATSGSVKLHGEEITTLPAPDRMHKGIGRAFQLTQLFPRLSVFENIRLAVSSREGIRYNMMSMADNNTRVRDKAMAYLEEVMMANKAHVMAAMLPHGDQRKLEVGMMLALEPEVFMFDEPTAGMSVDDAPVILDLIAKIKKQGNKTILLVEHKMDVVRALADRIIVLHLGELLADGDPATVIASPIVQEAYLGKSAGGK